MTPQFVLSDRCEPYSTSLQRLVAEAVKIAKHSSVFGMKGVELTRIWISVLDQMKWYEAHKPETNLTLHQNATPNYRKECITKASKVIAREWELSQQTGIMSVWLFVVNIISAVRIFRHNIVFVFPYNELVKRIKLTILCINVLSVYIIPSEYSSDVSGYDSQSWKKLSVIGLKNKISQRLLALRAALASSKDPPEQLLSVNTRLICDMDYVVHDIRCQVGGPHMNSSVRIIGLSLQSRFLLKLLNCVPTFCLSTLRAFVLLHLGTRDCVYKINCNDCTKVYIRQTARELHTRIGEHKRRINKPPKNAIEYQMPVKDSAMAVHALDTGHTIDLDNVEVLRRGLQFTPQRLIAEVVEITKRHSVNRIKGVELASIWKAVLDKRS
ncbi:hypothetical protein CLF_109287 [Clonorchis sinensis]|uniref:C2H2-type domain-containing protein n=1 Tax=Clonorchis sinensis TaxID=79923 RepID=G7YJ61_CLOSI|nr:hypothetical protein CLF_109287 [Clonorchis sinensis]